MCDVTVEMGDILFIIRPDGEDKYQVIADMRDINLWEKISPHNTLRKLAENPSSDDYYSLAHVAIRRQRGMTAVPPLAEWRQTTVVVPQNNAATSAGLDRYELVAVIEKIMSNESATVENIADAVLDLLEDLQARALNPTQ